MFFSLMDNILDITLYTQLQRDIGLKISNDSGKSTLGIRDIKVALLTLCKFPINLTSSTTLRRYSNIMSKKHTKKFSNPHIKSQALILVHCTKNSKTCKMRRGHLSDCELTVCKCIGVLYTFMCHRSNL